MGTQTGAEEVDEVGALEDTMVSIYCTSLIFPESAIQFVFKITGGIFIIIIT